MWEHLRDDYNGFTFDAKVPLLCDPSVPSFGMKARKLCDFFQLPGRLGWSFQENGDRSLDSGNNGIDHVVQRWLYFEVLAQVFGHLPDYSWEHFVKRDRSDTDYINTTALPRYLESWLDSEKKSEANERKSRLIRIQQVLDRARFYVSQHCAVPSRKDKATWEISDLLALSLMILGETLTRALSLIQRKLGFRIEGWCSHDVRSQGWGYSKLILQKLDDDDWCAKAIHMLQALLRGNSIGLVYLFTLRSSSSRGADHEQCTATVCQEMDMRKGKKKPEEAQYHYCQRTGSDFCSEPEYAGGQIQKPPDCTTDKDAHRSVDGRRLAEIINKGNIPLLRYRRANRDLQVVEMNQSFDKSYAIFSHVWTDGFGRNNGMSLCVLDMLSKMLEKAAVQRSRNKSAVPELFWIDTLAIPVDEEFGTERRKAIKQMHDIYTYAKYTIVLDLSLMKTTVGPGYSSPAMKITMCRWMTRLWTLQEAVLSKNLFFCFSDRIFPMAQLEDMFPEEDSDLQSCIPSLARIYHAGILGEIRPKIHEEFRKKEGWTAPADFLALVWKATQWRSTAHPIHETLSLATLLNQDTDFFANPAGATEGTDEYQQECDNRMVGLLSRFAAMSPCPIPPGMIFLPGPRLSKKAFGWAPKSWLSSHEIDSPDPLSLPDQGNTRLILTQGLEVQYPGFLLHDLGFDRKKLGMREEIYFPTDSTLLEWYRVRPAHDTPRFPKDQTFARHDLAIIVSRMPVIDLKETALFVAVKEVFGGIRYVEILNRVWISREENPEMMQNWSDKHREGHHEAMSAGERLHPTTKWCVDGPSHPNSDFREMTEEFKPTQLRGRRKHYTFDQEDIKALERSQTTGFRRRFINLLPFRRGTNETAA